MKTLGFIFLIIILSCSKKKGKLVIKEPSTLSPNIKHINYDSCKKQILRIKQNNALQWNNLSIQQKQQVFTKAITNTIIPAWIGTAWSYSGTSQIPQQGSIACGYFVTTVLQDGGVQLARIKLAQCASEQMIETLVQPKLIKRFSNLPMANFLATIKQMGYGLYIVGLDNHTGFIYNDNKTVHFIHSTFVGTKNVQWENAEKSWVLSNSKYKVLGKISETGNILNNWIK